MNINDIISEYERTGSMRAVAKSLHYSTITVRKCLTSVGAYQSDTYDRVTALRKQGKTPREIADTLNLSVSCVNSYLPYERGNYAGDSKTTAWRNAKAKKED